MSALRNPNVASLLKRRASARCVFNEPARNARFVAGMAASWSPRFAEKRFRGKSALNARISVWDGCPQRQGHAGCARRLRRSLTPRTAEVAVS